MNYKNLINKLKRNKKILEVENALTVEEEGSLRTKLESNLKYIYTLTEATELPIEFNFHHEPTKSSKEARLYLKTCLEDLGYDRDRKSVV